MSDETVAGIADGTTQAACNENISQEERQKAAGLAASYPVLMDDAEFQKAIIEANREYLEEHGNEGVQDSYMSSVASHAYDYDISNRDDIIQMIKDHGTEGAKQILEEAERQYKEQAEQAEAKIEAEKLAAERQKAAEEAAKAKEQQQAKNQKPEEVQTQPQTQQPQTQNTSSPFVTSNSNNNRTVSPASSGFSAVRSMVGSSSAAQIISSAEFKSLNAKDSVEILKKMSSADQKAAIRTIVERTEGIELQGYMFTEMKNPIIRYLVSNPSPKNNAKLQYIEKYLTAEDKKFMQEVKEECKKAGLVVEQNTVRKNPFSFEA